MRESTSRSPEVSAPGIWRDMWEGVSGNLEGALGMGRMWANPACVAPISSRPSMGLKRSLQCGGTLLGCLANILTILSSAANYWIRFPKGHSGLWQDCIGDICTNIPCQCEAQPVQMSDSHYTDSPRIDHSWSPPLTHNSWAHLGVSMPVSLRSPGPTPLLPLQSQIQLPLRD